MAFEIGIMDLGECLINGDNFDAKYQAHKVYLGRNVTLPQRVAVSLEFLFKTQAELRDFFIFWEEKTLNGAKPFYVQLPLFGDTKQYLILLDGELSHAEYPVKKVSGPFTLFTTRTLDENIAPVFENSSISIEMDSTSNFILFQGTDADTGDVLSYEVTVHPTDGTLQIGGNGAYYYTPDTSYSGTDFFTVVATDELGVSATATMTISIVNWQLFEAFKTAYSLGDLSIEYSNPALLTQAEIDALDTLANATVTVTAGEWLVDYTNTNIVSITQSETGHLIVETI